MWTGNFWLLPNIHKNGPFSQNSGLTYETLRVGKFWIICIRNDPINYDKETVTNELNQWSLCSLDINLIHLVLCLGFVVSKVCLPRVCYSNKMRPACFVEKTHGQLTSGSDLTSFLMMGSSVVVTVWKMRSILCKGFSVFTFTLATEQYLYHQTPGVWDDVFTYCNQFSTLM